MALFTTPGSSLGGITGSASLARLLVVISGNTSGLTGALASGAASLQAFNQNANALGNSLIRGVTLPTLALGGAAIKMAADYESAMGRVAGLTILTADQVNTANQEILDLAQEVPTAPKDLADALYFAGSAGLAFRQAMDVVELSAKGAAIGMGDASDISRVLITSLNAFQSTGLGAAEAMDALTAAVKVGTAEPEELAISLGRLVPIAAEVGLTFQETIAQVAALTNIGVPTRVATTSLRALFAQFLAPTDKARENLEAFGIEATELRSAVEAGPLVAFELLTGAIGEDDQALRNIIPQIRGLTGFLGLADEKLKDSKTALDAVRNSTGSLDKAFAIISDTSTFKFQLALNDLRVAAIEMGSVLLPVFNQLVSVISDVGESIAGIPGPMKSVLVSVLGLAAAMGPLLKLWGALNASGKGFLSTLPAMGVGFLTFAASLAIATGSLKSMANGTAGLGTTLIGTVAALTAARTGIGLLTQLANRGVFGVNALSVGLASMSNAAALAASAGIAILAVGIVQMMANSRAMARDAEAMGEAFRSAAAGGETFNQFITSLEKADSGIADDLREIATAAGLLNVSVGEGAPELVGGLTQSVADLNRELIETGQHSSIAPVFIESLKEAAPILDDLAGSAQELAPALQASGSDLGTFTSALDEISKQHPEESVRKTALALKEQALAAQEAAAAYVGFQQETEARILLAGQEESSIQGLADRYGVSTDVIARELGEVSIAAVGLTKDSERQFAIQAGLVDEQTGAMIGALNELRAAEAKVVADRQSSLRENLAFFGDLENAAKKSVGVLIASAEKQVVASQRFAQNTATLLAKGLDPGVLQFLVDQGPQMVGKFVDASAGQLGRLETAYALSMGAIDATILNEGKHQQVKGNDMVSGFATAILSSKHLPQGAAQQIMNAVSAALGSGKLKPSGLAAIQSFAEGISQARGVPASRVGPIVAALVAQLGRNPKFLESGQKAVQDFATGLVSKLGLPKAAAAQVTQALVGQFRSTAPKSQGQGQLHAQLFAQGIRSGTSSARGAGSALDAAARSGASGTLFPQGASLGSSLAAGIRSAIGSVVMAVQQAVDAAKAAAEGASRGSPKYFTYYLGQRIMDDYAKGLDSRKQLAFGRPIVSSGFGGAGGGKQSLKGMVIEGRLETPMGESYIRGRIVHELRDGQLVDKAMAHAASKRRF